MKLSSGQYPERVYLEVKEGEHLCQFVKLTVKEETLQAGKFVKAEDVGKVVLKAVVLFEIYPSKANKAAGESYNCVAKMTCSMTDKPQKSSLRKFCEYLSMDEHMRVTLPTRAITDGDFLEEWIGTYLNQWFYVRAKKGGWINFSDPLPLRPATPPEEHLEEAKQVASANLDIRTQLLGGKSVPKRADAAPPPERDELPEAFDNFPDHSDAIDSEVL